MDFLDNTTQRARIHWNAFQPQHGISDIFAKPINAWLIIAIIKHYHTCRKTVLFGIDVIYIHHS